MNNHRLTSSLRFSLIACSVTIGILASTQSIAAQSNTALAQVDIPFTFQLGGQVLPAGSYRIDRELSNTVLLSSPGHAARFVIMNQALKTTASDRGSIVFDRYGDKYFLRQIWKAGDTQGLECPKSRAEKETQRAMLNQPRSSTQLALNSVAQH